MQCEVRHLHVSLALGRDVLHNLESSEKEGNNKYELEHLVSLDTVASIMLASDSKYTFSTLDFCAKHTQTCQ